MKKVFKLKIPIYNSTLWLYLNPSYEDIHKAKVKGFKAIDNDFTRDNFNLVTDMYRGVFQENGTYKRIMIFDLESTYSSIPHEAAHATRSILDGIGAETIDDEVFAYLLGHISEFCFKCLDKYNKEKEDENNKK